MRPEQIVPGERLGPGLEGAVLTRDLVIDGARWSKGRRLTLGDLARLAAGGPALGPVTVIVLDAGDVHEDEAARTLAEAATGSGIALRGPAQSRVDLVAAFAGVLHVNVAALAQVNRVDPLEVFTSFDGSVVAAGDVVASVKIAPHVVEQRILRPALDRLLRLPSRVVRIAPFLPLSVAVVVKESLRAADRERFERSVTMKIESLGSTVSSIAYVDDNDADVAAALARATEASDPADIILTAGGRSTDPLDPFFVAIGRLEGSIVRRGVPAHPGSMLWIGRIGRTAVLGLPTCGAYSMATAADLVLPRLLTGERPSVGLVAGLGHGGLLTRDQRFRFPPYARDLDAPEG